MGGKVNGRESDERMMGGGKDEQERCREAGRATFHEMLKQQHGCQSNFTAQWFHTSAI